jgi:hypothetical protein
MDGPSNRVVLLLFCSFQALTFGFVQYMLNKQNQFYAQMISTQNLQIKELTANLSKLAMVNAEQGQLIIDLQFQQKILAGLGITLVIVVGSFLLFFYTPGVSPEVAQNHLNFIADSFIKQSTAMIEVANDVEKLKVTAKLTEKLLQDTSAANELLLNAAEAFETASKALS